MSYDVLVVGVGLAGLTAGLRLAQAGKRVLLVAKGLGGTHLGAGTIDVLGYGPERVDHPLEALPLFLAAHPLHPYARAGLPALSAAADWFLRTTGELGYPFSGSLADNFLLPTAVGAAKPAALVPTSMAAGDLRRGGKFLIAGFSNLKDFYPALLADNLARANVPGNPALEARGVVLDPPGLMHEADMPPLDFARAFDRPDFRSAIAAELRPRLQPGERVGFPALLGLRKPVEAWQDLQNRLGAPVFEIPTLPPSIPGIRLYERLNEAIVAAGSRFQIGFPVIEARVDDGRCVELVTSGAARPYRWSGEQVILATGGIASGGIVTESDGAVRESIFNLPLAGVPAAGNPRFLPGYFDSHPFSQVGLDVDDCLRPVNGAGRPVIANLRAAGAMLGHSEPWREKSGDGISLATGYRAAEVVLEAKRD
jgi:glycerol-3-phosphate dehydrogenase subunit B